MDNYVQKATKIICKIESIYSSSFKHKDIDYWPLIRMTLWSNLTTRNKKKSNIYLFLLKKNIKTFLNKILNLYKKKNINIKILFLSDVSSLCKTKRSNLIYDRYADPILKNLNKKFYLKIYNKFIFKNNLFIKSSIMPISPNFILKSYKLPFDFKKKIFKLSKKFNFDEKDVLNEFYINFNEYNYWYYYGKKIFLNCKNLKKIYLNPWYSSSYMGLIASSKYFKVKTIDIQHGLQGKYQPMYNHWKKVPKTGYDMLPDFYECWDNIIIKNHNSSSNTNFKKKHKSILIKDNWMKFYKKNFNLKKKQKIKQKILFCVQPTISKNDLIIPNFFINFLNLEISKDLYFIFRVHPAHRYLSVKIKEILKNKVNNRKNIKIDLAYNSLYDHFNDVTHCLSRGSTTSYEAAIFGVKSAVYGRQANKSISEYFNRLGIKELMKDTKSLKKWII